MLLRSTGRRRRWPVKRKAALEHTTSDSKGDFATHSLTTPSRHLSSGVPCKGSSLQFFNHRLSRIPIGVILAQEHELDAGSGHLMTGSCPHEPCYMPCTGDRLR